MSTAFMHQRLDPYRGGNKKAPHNLLSAHVLTFSARGLRSVVCCLSSATCRLQPVVCSRAICSLPIHRS